MEKLFRIKRYDPEGGPSPRWQEFHVSLGPYERLLDGLIRIKDTIDGSLTFRRSCAHGMCGSCAMKINGKSALACQTLAKDTRGTVVFEPLPAFPVIKDLAVDMDAFYEKNSSVMPYLLNDEPYLLNDRYYLPNDRYYLLNDRPGPERERPQNPKELERILDQIKCILCGCCTSACPVYWADRDYLGPAALVKASRFILDSRDRARGESERLQKIAGAHGLWRCHLVYNCVEVCPKSIDITAHISGLKRLTMKINKKIKKDAKGRR